MDTIFIYEPIYSKQNFERQFKLEISENFLQCADIQLRKYFTNKTGLAINRHIGVSFAFLDDLKYRKGKTSVLDAYLIISSHGNRVRILWNSESERIYDISDQDINCDDINFWFEDLIPLQYHQQLYPKEQLPFKLHNLNFELYIYNLNQNSEFQIYWSDSQNIDKDSILSTINKEVSTWNNNTEKEDAKKEHQRDQWYCSNGVIHSWNVTKNDQNSLILQFDLGSADIVVIKKILQKLSKLHGKYIQKIEIG